MLDMLSQIGISRDRLFIQMKDHDLEDTINTNLLGTMYVTRQVAKAMIRKRKGNRQHRGSSSLQAYSYRLSLGGCIINISSVIGLSGNVGQCAYSASKAGIIGTGSWSWHESDLLNLFA